MRHLVDERFDGNVTKTAAAIGVSQSLLYEFLDGTRGAGMKLLEGVADLAKVSVDQIVGRSGPSGAKRLRDMPGYEGYERQLKERFGHRYSETAFQAAGDTSGGQLPSTLDAATVLRFVQFWYDMETTLAGKAEEEAREVDAIIAADKARSIQEMRDRAAKLTAERKARQAEERSRR